MILGDFRDGGKNPEYSFEMQQKFQKKLNEQ